MNESKAPKLDPKKLVNDISALHGESQDMQRAKSPSGKSGLRRCVRTLYKIPVLGYFLSVVIRVIMLPKTVQRLNDELTDLHNHNNWLQDHIHRTNIRLDEQNDKMQMCFDALKNRIENLQDTNKKNVIEDDPEIGE